MTIQNLVLSFATAKRYSYAYSKTYADYEHEYDYEYELDEFLCWPLIEVK